MEVEKGEQFWTELDAIVHTPCETQQTIDTVLKAYLGYCSTFADEHLVSEYDWAKCAFRLLEAPIFRKHKSYVRRRMMGRLRKETAAHRLHLVACVLLFDGRDTTKVFENMQEEGLFLRLVDLVRTQRAMDPSMWSVALDLLYEMSRIQRLRSQDLVTIEDDFVRYLFELVEEDPTDPDDPYHYPIIRMLLVLNEQYMVMAHSPLTDEKSSGPTNKVIKTLCYHGSKYKTFGENIILLINRESETCLQLLILKLLYLLFTTTATYEYFYYNDLRVLVDVIIRNLLDLPDEAQALRHTYLRVLYPLLNHSQLKKNQNHYKREELLSCLDALSGGRSEHFEPADPTTLRLVSRCMTVSWLKPFEYEKPENPAHRQIGMSLGLRGESSISVAEVAHHSEKPGVITPSRTRPNNATTNGVQIAGEA